MLGRSHVVSGIAGSTIALATIPALSADIPTTVAAISLIAGGAIVPDLDHPGATISRSLPPVSKIVSHTVSIVSGGHRNGTHGIIGWLVFGILTFLLCLWTINVGDVSLAGHTWHVGTLHIGMGLICGFCCGIALTALHLDPLGVPSWIVAAAAFIITAEGHIDPIIAGTCMMVGCAIHSLLGDGLTTERVPLLYPFSKHRFGLPILGKTGSNRETLYVALLLIMTVATSFWLAWR